MRASAILVILCAGGIAAAQPIQSQHHVRPDLKIVKSVATPPQGAIPAIFDVVVTNVGTSTSGPFTVTDVLTPPAFFDPSNLSAQAPWVCATFPAVNPTYLTCTHPGPLVPGNSAVLQVQVHSPTPGEFENCASVSCDGDPNEENNEDCACTDFKPCTPISIDISTGADGGVKHSPGTPDPDWTVAVDGNAPVTPTTTTLTAWTTSPTAQWISTANPPSVPGSSFVYELDFTLGHETEGRICSLNFQYAADNDVTIALDSNPIASLSGSVSSNFTTLHSRSSTFTGSFGPHTLQATVIDTGGYTGLLIGGTVRCTCEAAPTR